MILSDRIDPDSQTDDEMVAILVEDSTYTETAARFVVNVLRGRVEFEVD